MYFLSQFRLYGSHFQGLFHLYATFYALRIVRDKAVSMQAIKAYGGVKA